MPSQATRTTIDMNTLSLDGEVEIVIDEQADQTIVEVDHDGDWWALLFNAENRLDARTPAPPVSVPPWLGPTTKKPATSSRVA